MSQSTAAVARPLPRRAPAPRPRLTVVPAAVAAPSGIGFVAVCLLAAIGALVASLLMSTAGIEDSFRAEQLRSESAALSAQSATLKEELDKRSNPAWLAEHAQAQGMLPAGSPGQLDAVTGRVTGVAMLPDPKAALTVLTGKFADQVPPLVREDKRPAARGILSPATTNTVIKGAAGATPVGPTMP